VAVRFGRHNARSPVAIDGRLANRFPFLGRAKGAQAPSSSTAVSHVQPAPGSGAANDTTPLRRAERDPAASRTRAERWPSATRNPLGPSSLRCGRGTGRASFARGRRRLSRSARRAPGHQLDPVPLAEHFAGHRVLHPTLRQVVAAAGRTGGRISSVLWEPGNDGGATRLYPWGRGRPAGAVRAAPCSGRVHSNHRRRSPRPTRPPPAPGTRSSAPSPLTVIGPTPSSTRLREGAGTSSSAPSRHRCGTPSPDCPRSRAARRPRTGTGPSGEKRKSPDSW